jgi:hypothetical protein
VNLTQLALFFPSRALIASRYRRIQRFFSHHWLDYNEVASFVMKLFGFTENDFYLSLDRTNWKWGKININLLAEVSQFLFKETLGNANFRKILALSNVSF